jgi:hypothetical protein
LNAGEKGLARWNEKPPALDEDRNPGARLGRLWVGYVRPGRTRRSRSCRSTSGC